MEGPLQHDQDTDYTLHKEATSVWITVDNIAVCIQRTDEGVAVDCYASGAEMSDSLASTYAFFSEAQEALDEEKEQEGTR